MCGITGFLRLNHSASPAISPERLTFITDLLTHRGPDDSGIYFDSNSRFSIGLGHRRLSILDISGGHQPWLDNQGSLIAVAFNGEIYNYPVLKKELEEKGWRFKTHCDTEIIAPLYREYGEEFAQRLSGMFAIALWDAAQERLVLSRDPVGKKPVYYAFDSTRIVFASELKSVIAADETLKSEIDPLAAEEYFTLQYIPAPRTIYQKVSKLQAGETRIIRLNSSGHLTSTGCGSDTVRRWIQSGREAFALRKENYQQSKKRLRDTLTEAVSDRMISDVPLGAFLSGGIDSTIVVGLMQSLSSQPIRTFSIGFDDPAFDETSYARQAAKHLKTDHTEFRVTPDGVALMDDLITHFDEPFADSSALPTWYVSNLARKEVTVALTGDGGDELFLGYERYKAVQIGAAADTFCPAFLRRIMGAAVCSVLPENMRQGTLLRKLRRFAECFQMNPLERYLDWVCYYNASRRKSLFSADFQNQIAARLNSPGVPASLDYLQPFFDAAIANQPARQIGLVDLQTYLPEDLLVKVDRTAMANSLECRCPILDKRVIELAAGFPQSWALSGNHTKKIFIETFADFLPPDIQTRKKMGFGVPLYKWFKSGPLHDLTLDAFASQNFASGGIFQPDAGVKLLQEHVSGRFDHSHRLWALLFFTLWQNR